MLSPLDHRKHDPPAQVPRALLPVEDSRQEGRREQYPGATILQWCGTRKADRRPDEPQEPGGCNSESCTNNIHFFRAAGTRAKCRVPASCKIFWFEVLSIGTQFSLPSFLSFPFDSFQSTQPLEPRKTFLSLRPCLKRRETLKNFVTHGDIERRTRSLRRARSVERRLGHTTCCFCRRSSHRLRAVWVPSCVTFPLS